MKPVIRGIGYFVIDYNKNEKAVSVLPQYKEVCILINVLLEKKIPVVFISYFHSLMK